jgi:hypothetical protein
MHSVGNDSGIGSEYTHISSPRSDRRHVSPTLRVKIKYPIEADDAARAGMLTPSDFDEILLRLQDSFQTWEIFLDTKRTTNYSRHVSPKTSSPTESSPQIRIIVKVKFSAWRAAIDVNAIKRIVEDVLNQSGEFFVDIRCSKVNE